MVEAMGRGVFQSDKEALIWLRKAADREYAVAQCNQGSMYLRGQEELLSYKEAAV